MSEQLLESLQVSFTSHGVESERSGSVIHARNGLAIEPRVFTREAVGGTAQVQVDFAVKSPRLPWMRVFMGALDGKRMGSEVRVDGEVWPVGQALLDAHVLTFSPGYASFRHLLIALPKVT